MPQECQRSQDEAGRLSDLSANEELQFERLRPFSAPEDPFSLAAGALIKCLLGVRCGQGPVLTPASVCSFPITSAVWPAGRSDHPLPRSCCCIHGSHYTLLIGLFSLAYRAAREATNREAAILVRPRGDVRRIVHFCATARQSRRLDRTLAAGCAPRIRPRQGAFAPPLPVHLRRWHVPVAQGPSAVDSAATLPPSLPCGTQACGELAGSYDSCPAYR